MTDLSNQPAVPDNSSDPTAPWMSRRKGLLLCLSVLVLAVCIVMWWHSVRVAGIALAKRDMLRGEWTEAKAHVSEYLSHFPDDADAHFLMAEALVKENRDEDPGESVKLAIQHLRKIAGNSELVAKARLQEGRLAFLVLKQPARAEQLFRESLSLDPNSLDANLLMWKLLDLTDRHIFSREYFWRVYELSSGRDRVIRLREWFLSEFYPITANAEFTSVFGAKEIGKIPASVNLWVRFRESEPEASFIHAALANYYLEGGRPTSSLELLKEAPDLAKAMQDPVFVTALFDTLTTLGEFDKATTCFKQFPEPHSGYLYFRTEGVYRQQVLNDAANAIHSYESALETWPAKFDWGLMTRLAECLRKAERNDEAQAVQARVALLTKEVVTNEKMSELRDKLRNLGDASVVKEMCELYRGFELAEEANAWEDHRQYLERFPGSF